MECLSPTVMNNYVTCFRMLTHLGVNNIWATGVLRNNRLRKCTIIGDKQPQKRNVDTLDRAHQAKKNSETLTVVGLNDNREVYIASSKFSEPKKFVRCMNKVEGKYIEKQQLNQFHCYNKSRVFFRKDGPERFQVQDWYPNEKIVMVPVCLYVRCFNARCCSSECMGVVSHWQRWIQWVSASPNLQFSWNIQRKANQPRTMKEFRMSHQMSVMRWHIIRCHLKIKACVTSAKITSDDAV